MNWQVQDADGNRQGLTIAEFGEAEGPGAPGTRSLHRHGLQGADGSLTAIPGATAPVVAAAPPGIGDWTIRLRDAAAGTSNPGRILVKSDKGGQAGPFTVSNG
jgi:hypothetical protein